MTITFQGKPITLKGTPLHKGCQLPSFTLINNQLEEVKSTDFTGITVFVAVPSLDTGVCDLEVKSFNEKAASLPGVSIFAVSLDLPFAQSRWCGVNEVKQVIALSDYKDRSFGLATGTFIEELALLTRAVFIVDTNHTVCYAEYVSEVTDHPNYDKIFNHLIEITNG